MCEEQRPLINIDWFFLFLIVWIIGSFVTGRGCWVSYKDESPPKEPTVEQKAEKETEPEDIRFPNY